MKDIWSKASTEKLRHCDAGWGGEHENILKDGHQTSQWQKGSYKEVTMRTMEFQVTSGEQ